MNILGQERSTNMVVSLLFNNSWLYWYYQYNSSIFGTNKNPIIGIKLYDCLDWCKIHSLMINRSHLTVEGINSIRKIKSGMNTGRSFEDK